MKTIFICTILLLSSLSANAQAITTTFENAELKGISIAELDSKYPSAAHYNPEKGVFKERQDEYLNHYRDLHVNLGKYLSKKGFKWPETVRLFTRVYFAKDGSIDYFLINPSKANLTESQQNDYFTYINEFSQDYKLPISANIGFSQCSPVVYQSKK